MVMNKTGRIVTGLLILFLAVSCRRVNKSFKESKDADMAFQIMDLPNDSADDNTLNYKVRIIPQKKLMETSTMHDKTSMYYDMDSCFYIIDDKHEKIYPSLVQPVANGVKDTYEYLLDFELNTGLAKQELNIIYADRYINHKSYVIKLGK